MTGRTIVPVVTIAIMVTGVGLWWLHRRFWSLRRLYTDAGAKSSSTLYICTTCCEGKRLDAVTANKIPTGPTLFRQTVARLTGQSVDTVDIEGTYETETETGAVLRIIPQKCLNACRQSNCVALTHPHKYQYHFTMLDCQESQDVEDLVTFAQRYTKEDGDAFTKKVDRPGKLAGNCISRLPPPIPTIAEKPI